MYILCCNKEKGKRKIMSLCDFKYVETIICYLDLSSHHLFKYKFRFKHTHISTVNINQEEGKKNNEKNRE